MEVDDILEHFGVLGMHWGIRRKKEPKGFGPDNKPVHELSDEELNHLFQRVNMEQRVNELTNQNTGQGKKYAVGLLATAGTSLVGVAVSTIAGHFIKKAITKAI